MRWRVESEQRQGALFDEVARHVGRGEYRGMEFLHVHARTIINTLPRSGRLPFRHTINTYRGCSHACSYCFARPTHDYLGLDIDEGFEHQIVVKVNAVERLRAELDPRRWPGDAIAMGTNTDPYQRAEGRYRLTRGLIEVLGAAANPFSILTKSSLVVRDLDVLTDAAATTDVAVSLSIGTLDPDVWKATEPGTPHPRQRLEAVSRLAEAGLRCGVLVAPVLPDLSDSPASVEAVVAASFDAGAATVSGGMVLHLRPGTREVFLRHLARTHPGLLSRYDELYRHRAYVPRGLQARVSQLVADAVARHRGSPVAAPLGRSPRRRPPGPATAVAPPVAEQLDLRLP